MAELEYGKEKEEEHVPENMGILSISQSASPLRSSLSEVEYDLKYSLPSNVMFLLGSSCSVALSVIDLRWNAKWGDDDYYYWEYYYAHPELFVSAARSLFPWFSWYYFLSIGGAILFILNAGIDLFRCHRISKIEEISIFDKNLRGDTYAAILFGMAATLDLRGSLISSSESGGIDGFMWLLSSHLYLFSALSTLSSMNYRCGSIPLSLNLIGDILFMIATLIDVSISYISDPDIVFETQHVLLRFGLLSSVLWLLDAILYIAANVIVLCMTKQKNDAVGRIISTSLVV